MMVWLCFCVGVVVFLCCGGVWCFCDGVVVLLCCLWWCCCAFVVVSLS